MRKSTDGLVSRTLTRTNITKFQDHTEIWLNGDEIEIIDAYDFKKHTIVDDDGDVSELTFRMYVLFNGAQIQEINECTLHNEIEMMCWSFDPHFYTRPEYQDAMAWRQEDTTETDWEDHKPTEVEFEATDQQAEDYYQWEAEQWDNYCRDKAEDLAAEQWEEEQRFGNN